MTTATDTLRARCIDAIERGSYDDAAAIMEDLGELPVSYDWVDAREREIDDMVRRGCILDTGDTEGAVLRWAGR